MDGGESPPPPFRLPRPLHPKIEEKKRRRGKEEEEEKTIEITK